MARTSSETKTTKTLKAEPKKAHPSPFDEIKRLYAVISSRVVGQEEAKRVVAGAIAIHQDRLRSGTATFNKSNVLIYGPTGSGKTEIIRTIVNDLQCPFVIVDASKLTPSGFIGEDPSAFLQDLLDKAGGNPEAAEQGIVLIDEIDKLASAQSSHEGSFQIRKVQAELLKIVEGQKITLKKKSTVFGLPDTQVVIDTTRILFIAAGAFEGIEDYLYPKQDREISMVFEAPREDAKQIEPGPADFIRALCEFGLMPELAGRFQLKARTKKLEKDDYIALLRDQKVSTTSSYYIDLLLKEGVDLSLSDAMVEDVADRALQMGLGVRGIHGMIESRMVELIFEIEKLKGKKVILEPVGYRFEGDEAANSEINKVIEILSESSFLVNLDRRVLSYVCGHGKLTAFKKGEKLMKEGDAPASVMILLSGSVMATNKNGLNIRRDELGSLFGEMGFLDGKKRTATLTAENDCRLMELSSAALSDLIKQRPEMGLEVLKALSKVAVSRVR